MLVAPRLEAKAQRVADELCVWASSYPSIRPVRSLPLALSVTAACPDESEDALCAVARVSLWVFALDDLFDEGNLSLGELLVRAARYRAIAYGDVDRNTADPLADALADVTYGLGGFSLFAALHDEWSSALCRTIDAMLREEHWRIRYRERGARALPSFRNYVENGLNSIGGPPHVWSAIVATGDWSSRQHLEYLRQMERSASICVRLANDLRSYEKEIAEQKFNSIVIISQGMGLRDFTRTEAVDAARSWVQTSLQRELSRLADFRMHARTVSGRPEARTADIAAYVCDFYRQHDYHTFEMGKGEVDTHGS
jgi:hypothetical protein